AARVRSRLGSPSVGPPQAPPRLGAGVGPLLPALVALAAAAGGDVEEGVAAVVPGGLVARPDALGGAPGHAVPPLVRLGVRPAGMVGVAAEISPGRAVDGPAAVELVEVAVAARLELVGFVVRELAALVLDNEGALVDRRRGEQAEPGTGATNAVGFLASHFRDVQRFAPATTRGPGACVDDV